MTSTWKLTSLGNILKGPSIIVKPSVQKYSFRGGDQWKKTLISYIFFFIFMANYPFEKS